MIKYTPLKVIMASVLLCHATFTNASTQTYTTNEVTAEFPLNGPMTLLDSGSGKKSLVIENKAFNSWQFFYTDNVLDSQASFEALDIPRDVIAYGVGQLANTSGQTVLFLTHNGISSFSLDSKKATPIISQTSLYSGIKRFSPTKSIPFINDLNQDGLSDFILQTPDSLHGYIQTSRGEFIHSKLNIKAPPRLVRDGVMLSPHDIYHFDINLDGKQDLIYQDEDSLTVFQQTHTGSFKDTPVIVPLNSGIVSEDSVRAMQYANEGEGKVKLDTAAFETVIDLNGDNILDVVTSRSIQDGFFDNEVTLEFRYGRLVENLLSFSEKPDASIVFEGRQIQFIGLENYKFEDLNQDGLLDVYFAKKDFGFGDIISGLISRSTDLDIDFYLQSRSGQFSKKPIKTKEVEFAFDLDNESAEVPLFKITDFDGDGHKDLIRQTSSKQIRVYLNDNQQAFKKRGQKYKVPLPSNAKLVEVQDLNGDNAADFILRYGALDEKYNARSIKVWLSNQ